MNKETIIPDCTYSIDGNFASIKQDDMGGNDSNVYIHKSHIAMIARDLGLMGGEGMMWRMVAAIHEARRMAAHCCEMVDRSSPGGEINVEEAAAADLLSFLDGVIAMLPEPKSATES